MFGKRTRYPVTATGSGRSFSEAHRNAVNEVRQRVGTSPPVSTIRTYDNGLGTVLVTCAYDPDGVLKEYAAEAAEQSKRIAGKSQPFTASAPGTFRSTARQAELNAAKFLRDLGFRDAYATSATSDGGIDVLGTRVVAQVKWQKSQVGRPAIQSFLGACHPDISNRILCFFAYSGFTVPATNFADSVPMALFRFDGSPTKWSPTNLLARELLEAVLKNR